MAKTLALFVLLFVSLAGQQSGIAFERRGHADGPNLPQAESENLDAAHLFARGIQYENGEGVPQSYDKARALYCEAAALDFPGAFFNLAWMYLNGRGVPRDDGIAVFWLQKASEHGIAQAANILKLMSASKSSSKAACSQALMIAAPADIQKLVFATAKKVGVNASLVMAVIAVESAFDPRAVSPKNAQGLMQLLPETAARFGVQNPFDIAENVRGGVTFLHTLLLHFHGDLRLALAAYNAGEATVLTQGGIPPYKETKDYVERVTRLCACAD